jgi:hypothetical protein
MEQWSEDNVYRITLSFDIASDDGSISNVTWSNYVPRFDELWKAHVEASKKDETVKNDG